MAPLYILRSIPLFSNLSNEDLKLIAHRLYKESYAKDEYIFKEGDTGNTMYIVESGQVAVVRKDGREVVAYMGPGNFVGEISLLLAQPRTASLKVTIDADLWVLNKQDFEELLSTQPSIGMEMTRELSQRLVSTTRHKSWTISRRITAFICTSDSVDNLQPGQKSIELAQAIHIQLKSPVGLLSLPNADFDIAPTFSDEVMILDNDNLDETYLARTLSYQLDVYKHIIVYLPIRPDALAKKALELADSVVAIGQAPDWLSSDTKKDIWEIEGTRNDIWRTARRLTNRFVGLALSSGGSRGLAHLGVLKVLLEEKIPIDLIAGTSAGAWFGAFFALGWQSQDYNNFIEDVKHVTRFSNWDLNIPPLTGIAKGRKARDKVIARSVDSKWFEDTIIPMYMVAADIYTGFEIIFESGPLADAIRASLSVPVLADPWFYQSRYFVDGGIVNPLPASVLRDKGADIVIASSVIQPLHKSYSGRRDRMPSILKIVSNIFSAMEAEVVKKQIPLIDLYIHHDVSARHNLDFEHVNDLVELGAENTRRMLPKIKEAIETPPEV